MECTFCLDTKYEKIKARDSEYASDFGWDNFDGPFY